MKDAIKPTSRRKGRGAQSKKFYVIQDEIAKKVKSGVYGKQMPSELQLSEDFGANPLTIRKALKGLEALGLVERRERVGTFVKRSQRVAVLYLVPELTDCNNSYSQVYVPLLKALEVELAAAGFLLISRMCATSDKEFAVALKNEVDGCVVIASNAESVFFKRLKEMPWIRVMSQPDDETDSIHLTYDNSMIGALAASYLVDKGSRVFVYFGHAFPGIFQQRFDAFKAKVDSHGGELIRIHAEDGMSGNQLFEAARSGIAQALESHPKEKLGVHICADMFAVSVYQAIYSLGLTPVKDIPVVSVDNNPIYLHRLRPRPATVDIRMDEIGRSAAQSILALIAGKRTIGSSNEKIIFPPIIREGEAAP